MVVVDIREPVPLTTNLAYALSNMERCDEIYGLYAGGPVEG